MLCSLSLDLHAPGVCTLLRTLDAILSADLTDCDERSIARLRASTLALLIALGDAVQLKLLRGNLSSLGESTLPRSKRARHSLHAILSSYSVDDDDSTATTWPPTDRYINSAAEYSPHSFSFSHFL